MEKGQCEKRQMMAGELLFTGKPGLKGNDDTTNNRTGRQNMEDSRYYQGMT